MAAGAAARGVRGDWGILLRLDWEPLRGHGLTTGVVRHACRHRVTARGVFGFGGSFHMLGAWERHRFNGGAVAVCFEGCCGSMCWPVDRPATHAAAGAAARGVRGDWGILLRLDWEPLRGHGLTTGVVRHACRHRVTARGVFGLRGLFCGFVGGAVAVCFEGCCGSMCWPVDRPGTHAAAGAAARGALIFCFGDCFTCSELGNDTMTMGGCCRLD